jgi:hypothetical protein
MAYVSIPIKETAYMNMELYTIDISPEEIYFEIDEFCNRLSFIENIKNKEFLSFRLQEYKDYCIFLQNNNIVADNIAQHIIKLYDDIFASYFELWDNYTNDHNHSSIKLYHYYNLIVQKIENLHDYLICITQQEKYTKFVICLTILS